MNSSSVQENSYTGPDNSELVTGILSIPNSTQDAYSYRSTAASQYTMMSSTSDLYQSNVGTNSSVQESSYTGPDKTQLVTGILIPNSATLHTAAGSQYTMMSSASSNSSSIGTPVLHSNY